MKPHIPSNEDPLKKLTDLWPRLRPWQRKSLLLQAFFYSLPPRLRRLRPAHVVIPAMLLQALVFVIAILHQTHTLPILGIGNIIIIALAMSPSLARSNS